VALEEIAKLTQTRVYLDGSCIDGKIGAATLMFRQGEEVCTLRKHVGDECHHTVYKSKVIGLTLAAELIALSKTPSSMLLQVSALHYSAGSQESEGFQTVASAHALCQPTIAGPSISIINIHKFGT